MHNRLEGSTLAVPKRSIDHLTPDGDVSTGEHAYRQIRSAIVRCDYGPETRLRVEELSTRFGVSSSPVREALHRLTVEGLVIALEQRGFRVAPITISGIRDLTRVRLLVESETLADAIQMGRDDWEASLVGAAHQLSKAEATLPTGPTALDDRWAACHRNFHLALYAGSTSPLLVQHSNSLFDLADRYRRYSATERLTPRTKRTEHRQILDAVLERDTDLAVALLRRHIEATERNVVAVLTAADDRHGAASRDHVA
jgi:GntR family transcriptional regulator, carbon starvation induced regulator